MPRPIIFIMAISAIVSNGPCLAQSATCSSMDNLTLQNSASLEYLSDEAFLWGGVVGDLDPDDRFTLTVTLLNAPYDPTIHLEAGYTDCPSVAPSGTCQFSSTDRNDPKTWRASGDGAFSVQIDFQCSSILPIGLSSIVAVANDSVVNLVWQTESETSNRGFEVQHREGTNAFETLGFVEGAGTTTEIQSYEYKTDNLDYGTHTFRLKQIDLDGGYSYGDHLEVLLEVPNTAVTDGVYPNPFSQSTTLRFAVSARQQVRVTLHDIQGRLIRNVDEVETHPHEMQQIQLDGTGLSSGVYLLRLDGEFFSTTETVTLVK